MKHVPLMLIYSRVLFGAAIILLGIFQPLHFRTYLITLITAGLLSDIFDGIIARRLGVSTQHLRRLDSTIDQFFWLCILAAAYIIQPEFFKDNVIKIGIILFPLCTAIV